MEAVQLAVNVIFLHGRRVCAQLDGMLRYWNTLLEGDEWSDFLFVLLDPHEPALSAEMAAMHGNRCLRLSDAAKADAGQIIDAVMRGMLHSSEVFMQCLCEACDIEGLELVKALIQQMCHHFSGNDFRYQLFLLLSHEAARQGNQAAVCTELMDTHPHACYLVSTVNQMGASVPFETMLHAVYSEMYAVLKKKRTLMNNTRLYSIGCSSLNAGNRELTRILENTAAQQMLKRVDKPYSHEEAWETLTGRPMSTYSQAGLRMALSSWLNDLSSAEIRLPTPDELRTARVFACLYDRDATEIRQAVDRFYLLNTGTQEQMRSQAQQLAQKLETAMLSRMSVRLNAAGFPLDLLENVCGELRAMVEKGVHPSMVTLSDRPAMPWARHKYIDASCAAFEKAREEETRQRFALEIASALIPKLEALPAFVENAACIRDTLAKLCPDMGEINALRSKYPKFSASLDEAASNLTLQIADFLENRNKAVFLTSRDGKPREKELLELRDELMRMMEKDMPMPFQGTFWQALALECEGSGQLERFFDRFLTPGVRLFRSILDNPGHPDSVYLADAAFKDNPWVRYQTSVMLAHNDNIERIDLYLLTRDLQSYLQEQTSNYFCAMDSFSGGGFTTLGSTPPDSEPPAVSAGAQPVQEPSGPEPDQSHGLKVSRCGSGRYVLSWDWKRDEAAALVSISQGGRSLGKRVVTSAEYYSPVGNAALGVDITESLSVMGPIQVRITYDGVLYARATVAGRQLPVAFSHTVDRKGRLVYIFEGDPENIRKVVMRGTSNGREIYYPVYAATNQQTFTGVQSQLVPCVDPSEEYPSVYIQTKN